MSKVTVSIVCYKNGIDEVTPLFNRLHEDACIERWVVVDNGSSNEMREAVETRGGIYLQTWKNIGFGGGHNLALKYLVGVDAQYHLILNPDIEFLAGTLCRLASMMDAALEVGLVMPQIRYPDGAEQRLCKQLPAPIDLISRRFLGGIGRSLFAKRLDRYELRHLDMGIAREIPSLSGCFMFIRAAALREVGFFDERYFMYLEDVDLCRRIGARYKTVFYPDVAVTHGYTKGSYRDPRLLKHHLQSAFGYFMKWGWIYDPERKRMNKRTAPIILNGSRLNSEATSARTKIDARKEF